MTQPVYYLTCLRPAYPQGEMTVVEVNPDMERFGVAPVAAMASMSPPRESVGMPLPLAQNTAKNLYSHGFRGIHLSVNRPAVD